MHPDQLDVDEHVVAGLVADQFPQWAGLPVVRTGHAGTVNAIFCVGGVVAARLPLRARDGEVVRLSREAEAGAALAAATTVPTPEPLFLGRPGRGYPLPWSVQTWLAGETADVRDPASSRAFAEDLAGFVAQVRAIDTGGRTFSGDGRGGDLRDSDAWVAHCLEQSTGLIDVAGAAALWSELRELPPTGPDRTTHGDLTTGNVLVSADLRLAGVLDTGGTGPADPALDLVGAWHLLDAAPRQVVRDALGCDDVEWQRGRAWALQQALGAVWYYADTNPAMARMGRRTIARVLESGA
ncbi:aminoglycoside phosphotransferase [Nocardioides mangrovicus]|uniref:Aminoglycoside phosphotransferase n=1 Tax=Nocardioides mangrovicus TaxID=2478913 RepID=A0A3L8P4E7_9ACTN|nr:phosphotransferase [Nocardioides mangrovicus]RLV49583.1 aminoglycoside phosphotransferase [Nocardioides mangrovicus]